MLALDRGLEGTVFGRFRFADCDLDGLVREVLLEEDAIKSPHHCPSGFRESLLEVEGLSGMLVNGGVEYERVVTEFTCSLLQRVIDRFANASSLEVGRHAHSLHFGSVAQDWSKSTHTDDCSLMDDDQEIASSFKVGGLDIPEVVVPGPWTAVRACKFQPEYVKIPNRSFVLRLISPDGPGFAAQVSSLRSAFMYY